MGISTRNIVHVHILHSAPLPTLCVRNNYYLLIPTIGYFYVCRSMRWSSNVKDPFRRCCFLSQPNTGNGRVPRVVVKILSSNVIVNYVRSLDLIAADAARRMTLRARQHVLTVGGQRTAPHDA